MIAAITAILASTASTSPTDSSDDVDGSESELSLDTVEKRATISDLIDAEEGSDRLPDGWSMTFEITQNQDGELDELVTLKHSFRQPKFRLESASPANPRGETRIVMIDPVDSVEKTLQMEDSFIEAFQITRKRLRNIEQRSGVRTTEADWNSLGAEPLVSPTAGYTATSTPHR